MSIQQETLTQRQDAALHLMHEPRTSIRRQRRHQSRVVGHFAERSRKLGYTTGQVEQQCVDLWDMYYLQANAVEGGCNCKICGDAPCNKE